MGHDVVQIQQQNITLMDPLKSFNIKIQTNGFMTLLEHNNKTLTLMDPLKSFNINIQTNRFMTLFEHNKKT